MQPSPLQAGSGRTLALVDKSITGHNRPAVEHFERCGWRVTAMNDGDRRGMRCDLLLLKGHARTFQQYARMLRGRADRPRTILWHHDPLLPPILAADERRALHELTAKYDRLDWIGSSLRWASASQLSWRSCIQAQHRLYRLSTRRHFIAAARRINQKLQEQGWPEIKYTQLRVTAECEHWIRRATSEGWLDAICMTTMHKQSQLLSMGIAGHFAPYGYHPGSGEDRGGDRPCDVAFLGAAPPGSSRQRRLEEFEKMLSRKGYTLKVVRSGCTGTERVDFLNRAKVLLHLHQYPWDTPWRRFVMGMSCGAAMVSDKLIDPRPFTPGEHFIEAEPRTLAEVLLDLLADANRRRAMARRARDFITEHFTMRQSVETILKAAFERTPGRD